MRICLVYDCLFPHTVGGAERWYRRLGEQLAAEGHEVTYLTLRQWRRGTPAHIGGVDVRAVGPQMSLYSSPGQRRILPPIIFGTGVFWHLLRYGNRYDVVHTASFPYFSLLAAGAVRPLRRFRLVVDWHEFWTLTYWQEYLGRVGGLIGWAIQSLCLRIPQRSFCFSSLHSRRLLECGIRGRVTVLEGEYEGPQAEAPTPPAPEVVFAGRHIPEKRAAAVVPAVVLASKDIPGLKGVIFGDGPDRPRTLAEIRRHRAEEIIEAPGFVPSEQVDRTLRRALCMVLPSRREGYGLIVVEASALGVPSVVVRAPDNAATELIQEGVNGTVANSAEPEELAAAILRVHRGGDGLRASTAAWYRQNAERLSLRNSLEQVLSTYDGTPRNGHR